MRHELTRLSLSTAVLAGGALLSARTATADATYRVIAVTGETAPGTNALLDDFHHPRLNAAGQVAFFAKVVNGDSTLYRSVYDDPSSLQLVLRTGDDVPGGPVNATFGEGSGVRINDDGTLGFSMTVDGLGGAFDEAIFRFRNDALETVAIPGQQVPGMAPGVVYSDVRYPAMNAHDSMAFRATFEGPGIVDGNDVAIMAHGFGGVGLVAREGGVAPGRPNDDFGTFAAPMIDDTGRLSFWTNLNHDYDMSSIWTGWPGLLTPAIVTNEGAWNADAVIGFSPSADGIVVYTAGPTGLLRDDGNGLDAVAMIGDPGPLGTYDWINSFQGQRTNASGALLFAAEFVEPTEAFDSAIVRIAPNGQPSVMMREGDTVPGFWDGVVMDDVSGDADAEVDFDDAGRSWFSVPLRGNSIHAGNDRALLARGLDGTLHNLLREGQMLDVGGGDWRVVESFDVSYTYGTQSGRRGATNELGDIALTVQFTDDEEAIVVIQLGTPCSSDVNHDGFINMQDLLIVLANWGQTTPIGADGDTNRDGTVDFSDLIKVLADWGVCA